MKPNNQSEHDLSVLRHSAAHLLAHAVMELFPKTKLTIGPATKDGFFYDLLPEQGHNFKEEDLPKIDAHMREISAKNYPITHKNISKDEARKLFKDNPFKLELIDTIPGDIVGLAEQGNFYDLCKGGHVASTGDIKYFKLEAISGSYWRADRNNQALQRISGTAFFTAQDLASYEKRIEEALMYDHRKLGKQMELFSFHDESVGSVFFHNKGKKVVNTMIAYLRSLLEKANYQEISTPIILDVSLWKRSGHYAHYKDNMYFTNVDNEHYALKPMNCPGSILVYSERPHSYRELPLRLAEFGINHRYELSGVLHGLMRVRSFTMDDAHIYCTVDQMEQEILTTITMAQTVYKKFGFEKVSVYISTRPASSMGTDEQWNKATDALKSALDKAGVSYGIKEGEGAFYGPKIEFHIHDSMERSWQCGTIQVDFNFPANFDLTYITSAGTKEQPVMLHRAIYGSIERFLAILLEHHKGHLPFWVAPIQMRVLTITDAQKEYAKELVNKLKAQGLRAELDESSDQISQQIKVAQLERIPWMLVIGKKEVEQNTITLRHNDGKQEFGLHFDQLLEKANNLING
ncbi:MAG TPA: threonine--tRNA ligase [Candidatus Babeliales bacterium]|nr:threonine--tRNA ligase [Candidatus Babeliales bacterium]